MTKNYGFWVKRLWLDKPHFQSYQDEAEAERTRQENINNGHTVGPIVELEDNIPAPFEHVHYGFFYRWFISPKMSHFMIGTDHEEIQRKHQRFLEALKDKSQGNLMWVSPSIITVRETE